MFQVLSDWFARTPGRLVRGGLCMFFAGAAALLLGAVAQWGGPAPGPIALADRFPAVPTWFVPEGAWGFTAASMLVCWGVWALGAGLRLVRARAHRDR